nr:hypothetical protein [Tanacetum cinerariifolium]
MRPSLSRTSSLLINQSASLVMVLTIVYQCLDSMEYLFLPTLSVLHHSIDVLGVLLLHCSKLGYPSVDLFKGQDSNCKGGDAAGSGVGRIGGDAGSVRDGICGNGDDNRVSGDGGGLGIAKNLSASSLVKDSVGGWGLKDILAVTRSAGGAGSSSGSSSSSSSRSSFGSDSRMYPGDSVVGEAAAGSGCSSAGKTSSSSGIYSGYTGSGT